MKYVYDKRRLEDTDKIRHFFKYLAINETGERITIAPHSTTENKDLNQLIPYSLMILPPKHGHLKYYDYGAAFGVLIYSDDDDHKISCGYVITDHNSTPRREAGKMMAFEIKEKKFQSCHKL